MHAWMSIWLTVKLCLPGCLTESLPNLFDWGLSVCVFLWMFICLWLTVCTWLRMLSCFSEYLHRLSSWLTIWSSISLATCLSVFQSVCLSMCLPLNTLLIVKCLLSVDTSVVKALAYTSCLVLKHHQLFSAKMLGKRVLFDYFQRPQHHHSDWSSQLNRRYLGASSLLTSYLNSITNQSVFTWCVFQ